MSHEDHVEVLSDASNAAVVRMPGRNFPGVVVQGDTLNRFCRTVDRILNELERGDLGEARGEAELLRDDLSALRMHYVKTLGELGMQLPFGQ